jgi:hypothetical protein
LKRSNAPLPIGQLARWPTEETAGEFQWHIPEIASLHVGSFGEPR